MITRPPLSLLLVAVLAAVVHAQDIVYFPQRTLSGIVDFDVDGDGVKDSIDFDYEGVAIRHGHGNGTFDAGVNVIQAELVSMIAGDVTGDGVPDIVALVGGVSVTALAVFPGTGTSFGAGLDTPVPHDMQPSKQLLADVNCDGLADWIANVSLGAFGGAGEVDVALSGGGGSFSFTAPTPLSEGAVGFALGDFDGDGDLDLATSPDDAVAVNVRLGAGDGSFAAAPISAALPQPVTSALSAFNSNLAARDLDGDGLCDLIYSVELLTVAGGPFTGFAGTLHSDGGGSLSQGPTWFIPASGPIAFGDCNGDAVEDAVIFTGSGLAALLGDGVGGLEAPIFSAALDNVSPFPANEGNSPSLVDLDGDGVLDGNFGPSFVSGRGDGSFVGGTHLSVGGKGPRVVAIADMNGDGARDLVVPQKKIGLELMVLLGDGHANFELHDTGSLTAQDVALGDLDGDGDVDIVAADNNTGAETAVRENSGDGLSYSAPAAFLNFMGFAPKLADLDGDGALDLLTAKAGQKDLLRIPGDGQGGFLAPQTITTGVIAAQFELADLDANGTPDIVTRSLGQSQLELLSGLGGGAFGTPQDVPVAVIPNCFAISDLDGNGLQDLVTGNQSAFGHGLHLLFAQGPGVFGPDVSPGNTYDVTNVRAADIDRDGSPDLVTTYDSAEVQVFQNLGDGEIAEAHASLLDSDENLLLDDMNGDGFDDVIAWDTASDHITVLPNLVAGFPSVGFQHPASFGMPHLVTTGAPVPDTTVAFTATGVPAPALGALFLGLEFSPQPFAGGTLVPSPDVMLPTRAGVPLAGRWPDLPAGTRVYAQAWFAFGDDVTATNAIEAITP
jgi:FG-GAP-like repeat